MLATIASRFEFAEKPTTVRVEKAARFTLDGDDELENHLACVCEKVLAGIQKIMPPRKLEALLLGGGYGRGEGGVLKTETGDRPYNDLEFYVFIRGNNWLNERRFDKALHHLSLELTPEAGVEVEFKIISSAKLHRSPASMFYYDLVMGHRQLWGDEKLLVGYEHHRIARNIPLSEATRLMMNRCSGLLFAHERLQREFFTDEDADFVGRNLAKAQLAFGDAALTAFGQYHWSCLERHERLKQLLELKKLPWLDEALNHHAAGVEFKLHPYRTLLPRVALQTQHENVTAFALKVWLWLESRRLGCHFESALDYALNQSDKCPDTNPWRNFLVNVKLFGPAALFRKRSWRNPRERILKVLALLLWETSTLNSELKHCLQRELWPSANERGNSTVIYRELWRQLN